MARDEGVPAMQEHEQRDQPTRGRSVVGVDDSEFSLKALHWAADHADLFGPVQPVTAWHHPWWSRLAQIGSTEADDAAMTQEVRRLLEPELAPIDPARRLDLIVRQGSAGAVLVAEARPPDVLIVGTRERGSLADTVLGSVSLHCVNHSRVPVVIVPPHAGLHGESERAVVGVDGSSNSIAALRWALRYLPESTSIDVLHTWHLPIEGIPEIVPQRTMDAEHHARGLLERSIRLATEQVDAASSEPHLTRRLVTGDPRRSLEAAASGLDWLIVGARGSGPMAHLPLGSVASALAHQPITTLVVVPPDDRAGARGE